MTTHRIDENKIKTLSDSDLRLINDLLYTFYQLQTTAARMVDTIHLLNNKMPFLSDRLQPQDSHMLDEANWMWYTVNLEAMRRRDQEEPQEQVQLRKKAEQV